MEAWKAGRWFFYWCLARVRWVLPKQFSIVKTHFFSTLPKGKNFLGAFLFYYYYFFVCVFDSSVLEASAILCLRYMGSNEEIQRSHHCVIPKVLRSLGCRPYFHLSVFLCLLYYIQRFLVVRRKIWEEWWGYFISGETETLPLGRTRNMPFNLYIYFYWGLINIPYNSLI